VNNDFKVLDVLCRTPAIDSGIFLVPGDPGYEEARYEIALVEAGPEWTKRLVSEGIGGDNVQINAP